MSEFKYTDDKWLCFFFDNAMRASRLSKDTTKVGACIADGKRSLLTGFNGPPEGVADIPERLERPLKYDFVCHAEQNVIASCAREGISTKGRIMIVTHPPCVDCAKLIIQSGIKKVYHLVQPTVMNLKQDISRQMFYEAQVGCFAVEMSILSPEYRL